MSKKQRLVSFLIAVILMGSFCCYYCSAAVNDNTVGPLYNNIYDANLDMYVEYGKIGVRIKLTALTGTTYEGGILTLKQSVGSSTVFLENLRNLSSSTSTYSYYNNTHDATSGTYTVKFAIYAVRDGVRERINLEKTLVVE